MRKKADSKTDAKKGKGRNYSASSVNTLLNLIEERLPIGNNSWELLALAFNNLTGEDRSGEGK
jgi:hypothetical protein